MAKSKYELIVVGAGVVGMGIALAAHKKGLKTKKKFFLYFIIVITLQLYIKFLQL